MFSTTTGTIQQFPNNTCSVHIVGTHNSKSVSVVYRFGPFLALYRAAIISFHGLKLTIWRFFFRDIKERASKFRETLICLGPFYVKLGQALSTRPDILPPVYCEELAKLQDQIPPFPTHVAIKSIENELDIPASEIFADISLEPIAAASIGQVYKGQTTISVKQKTIYLFFVSHSIYHFLMLKAFHPSNSTLLTTFFRIVKLNTCSIALSLVAHLPSGELVAVKVQRPSISLFDP
ncbi:hypothetical protein J1N35_029068 [Gossypium stocksii]|uniref:ABC1 atypical kinase-like domain-containing protein n=1 Tax=Gossypium stocksii TaxID=47602 RepID=A0A9D3UX49_9ROSI|nr:hypothetical protein J1N35_029068 [Gossypium stocksii]